MNMFGLRRKQRVPLAFEELEQRILYSADAVAAVNPDAFTPQAEVRSLDAYTAPANEPAAETRAPAAESRHEIVFVDTQVADYEKIVADIQQQDDGRDVEVVLLAPDRDGVEQITETLAGRQDIDAVHIVSHGASGAIRMGDLWLTQATLAEHESDLQSWREALTQDADILIYGCDVAAGTAGKALTDALARLTGADVAASVDATGSAALHGNWTLEYIAGAVETRAALGDGIEPQWLHLLANETVRDTFSAVSYSNNDGTQAWTSDWIESDSTAGGAAAGYIQVTGNTLRIEPLGAGDSLYREADLSSATSAILSYAYDNTAFGGGTQIDVQVSSDGGANYTTLKSYTSLAVASGTDNFDITAYASANTRVRFLVIATNNNDFLFLDDVQIAYVTNAAPVLDAARSPALTAQNEDSGAPSGAVGSLVSSLVDFAVPAGQVDNVTDADAGALLGIAVTNADTTNGTWFYSTNNGAAWNPLGAVANNSARLLAADANTRIYFQPNANFNGGTANAITFRAWDLTSGANGATADTTANGGTTAFSIATDTASLTINAVNDAPTVTSASLTVSEGQTVTLSGANFAVTDVDNAAFTYTVSGVTGGFFQLSSAAGTPITSFTSAQLAGGLVQFVDDGDEVAPAFSVKVNDGTVDSNTLAATITYTPVNDTPVMTSASMIVTKGRTVTLTEGDLVVTDPDNTTFTFTVSGVTGGFFQLSTAAGTPITTFTTAELTSGLVQFVDDGNAVAPSFSARANDGTANSNTVAATITFYLVNDAPVLDNTKSPVLAGENEDAGAPVGAVGTLVSSLVDFTVPAGQVDNVTDSDTGALLGIAVTAADTTNGTWHYSTNNGASWNALGAVSAANARLLAANANTRIYFQPNANFNGTLANAITFHAWDRSTGSNGGTADLTSVAYTVLDQFGAVSYNNNNGTANWTSNWVETADNGSPVDGNISVTGGELRVDNADAGLFENIRRQVDLSAATSATLSFDWRTSASVSAADAFAVEVSSNGGMSWTTLETFTGINGATSASRSYNIAAFTASNTQIRFAVTTGYTGASDAFFVDNAQIAYATAGTGDITPFSVATDTASLTVNAVNDAPALGNGSLAAVNEDTSNPAGQAVSTIFSGQFSDIDAGASFGGIAIVGNTANPATQGTWQYSSNAGTNWFAIGAVADGATALAVSSSSLIRFLPATNFNGAPPALTVRGLDNSYAGGYSTTAGAETRVNVNTTVNGGATAIAAATATLSTSITAVNDAPVVTSAALTLNEGQTVTLAAANFSITDPDNAAFTYTVSGITGGFFQLSSAAGTPITSFTTAQLGGGLVQFVDDGNEVAPAFSVTVNDGTANSNTLAATVTYSPVNDAPVVTSAALTLNEGQTVTLAGANFGVTDPDNAAFTYTVSGIAGGFFQLSSAAGTPITSFTTAQLAGGLVQFVDDGNEVAPAFSVTVNDGTANSNTLAATISYTPVNDAPVVTSAALTVSEGQTIGLSAANFGIADPDNAAFTYTVSGITGGFFQLSSAAGTPITTFTTGQLGGGLVQFVDDGNEVAPAFSVTVNDGTAGSNTLVATITYNPVNDAPVLSSAALTLNEGQTVTLAAANFGITDPDNAAFTYTVSGVTGGFFQLSSAAGTPITSFTTAQLGGGLVQFVDDGNEVAPAFNVKVNDGAVDSTTLTATITYSSVNDAPVVTSTSMLVTRGRTATLTERDFVANDPDNAAFTFAVSGISGGFFQLRSVPGTPITTFTTAQLTGGLVQFVDDGDAVSPTFSAKANDGSVDSNTVSASITFYLVNSAPVLDGSKTPVLAAESEDAGAPAAAVGTLVSSLVDFAVPAGQVDNVTDGDPGAPLGIAITGADTTNGTWHYSTDGGASWNPLGAVANNNARLLAADVGTRIYFQPNANFNGAAANAITFHAWDGSIGANGSLADLSSAAYTVRDNFGAASYSNNDGTANWSTNWIDGDDISPTVGAVQISGGELRLNNSDGGIGETVRRGADLSGATSAMLSFDFRTSASITATDSVSVAVSSNGGGSWTTLETFTGISGATSGSRSYNIAAQATASNQIRFTTNNGLIGVSDFFYVDNFQIAYTTSGVGDITPFSTAADTAILTVSAVADTPSVTNATTNEDTQTTTGLVVSRNVADAAEVTHFKITGITNGTLYKNDGVAQIANGGFITFAEGNAGLKFTPGANFNGSGSFTVQASTSNLDAGLGGATVNATITVNAVNDAPVVTTAALTVAEGQTVTLSAANFSVTDPDNAAFTYTVSSISGGFFQLSGATGAPITTFTGAQVAGGLVQFVDDGDEVAPAFSFTANDGTANSNTLAATITYTPVNDAPVVTSAALTVNEGQTVMLSTPNFTVTDPDNAAFAYTVSGISGGFFQFSGAPGTPIATFTTAQLTGSLVQFVDDGDEVAPAFSFAVNDGTANSNTLTATITFTPVNDAPAVTSASMTLSEGQTVTLSAGNFAVTDPDSGAFTYTVSSVTGGFFGLSSAPAIPVLSFTSAQLAGGLVQFVDDGNELAPAFSVTVNDGTANSNTLAATITYTPLNDAPLVTSAVLTVSEGQTVTLGGVNFGVTDPDSAAFTYTVSSISGAFFQLSGAPGTPITTFTTAQLTGGLVQFADDGNEVAPAFSVTVNDGTAVSNTLAAAITYTPVNDAPIVTTAALTLNEAQTVTLSGANFSVTDPDNAAFTYSVSGVTGGFFALSPAPATPITTFTSVQLAGGQVRFVDDGDEVAPAFSVTVNDGSANSNTLAATVNYTPVNDAPVVTSAALTVAEGQTVTLSAANVGVTDPDSAAFTYTVSGVAGGFFQLSSAPGTPITSFTSAQLAGGFVQFVDDGNEVAPAFSVRVNDGLANSNTRAVAITYTPVNDAPVLNNATLSLSEGQTRTVTAANFSITDPDNAAFTYTVSSVTGGFFALSTAPAAPITTFTSAQLSAGQVRFVDDGNEVAPSFSVTVSDGAASSNTRAATITYTPVNDAPVLNSITLTLSEGETVTLAPANFVITDPDSVSFTYSVSVLAGGYFQLASAPGTAITAFTDAQLSSGMVQFVDYGNEVAPAFSVRVRDGFANSLLVPATITYSGVNDAPFAGDESGTPTFDGIDDYVSVPSSPSLTMTSTLTIEAVVRPAAAINDPMIIVNKEGEYEIALLPDGMLQWAFANTNPGWAWHQTGYRVPFNVWSTIAVTYNNGVIKAYVDGVLVDTYNGAGAIGDIDPAFNELRIAARSSSTLPQNFHGQIDEVRLWNVERTAAEIASTQMLTGNETGLVGLWRLGESTGSAIVDASGHGNNGTFTGVVGAPAHSGPFILDEDGSLSVAAANGVLADDSDPENDPLTAILVAGPAHGSLAMLADGSFIYTPDANFNGIDTFSYKANDGLLDSNVEVVRITVNAVSDAPAGQDGSIATAPQSARAFSTADFGFTDPRDAASNAGADQMAAVHIVSLPTSGGLTLAGVPVNVGQIVTAADIASGSLVYSAGTGGFIPGSASFTFRVQDTGGTANGGVNIDPTARTMSITIAALPTLVPVVVAAPPPTMPTNEPPPQVQASAESTQESNTSNRTTRAVVASTLPPVQPAQDAAGASLATGPDQSVTGSENARSAPGRSGARTAGALAAPLTPVLSETADTGVTMQPLVLAQLQSLGIPPGARFQPATSAAGAGTDESDGGRSLLTFEAGIKISGAVVSAGLVAWALRGAGLLTSLLASVPAWRFLDPVPVLAPDQDKPDWDQIGDDESAKEEHAVHNLLSGRSS